MDTYAEQAGQLLAYWVLGVVDETQIVAWADRQILNANTAPPSWLVSLSLDGPEHYLKTKTVDDPRASELSFKETFLIWVEMTPLDNAAKVRRFMRWLVQASLGLEFDEAPPIVSVAYQIDHLWSDCNQEDKAVEKTVALLEQYKPSAHLVRTLLSQ